MTPVSNAQIAFDLGLWLSGLESFLNIRNHSFADNNRMKISARDWTREFRLTHSALILCSRLVFQLVNVQSSDEKFGLICSEEEMQELSEVLKDSILLNEGLIRGAPLKLGEWTAWSNLLGEKLGRVAASEKLIAYAERKGEDSLPAYFSNLLESNQISFEAKADLKLVLPRFAKILKWLDVVGVMLERDEPLKPALLIFSRIYEQINELTGFINNRLLRFPNEEDELFGTLDGAAYTASIELRKVFSHELSGLVDIRTTPSVYAKIETAYALLNDSFQLTLFSFAKLIDESAQPEHIFPNLKIKFEHSVVLRDKMWKMLQDVRNVEREPDLYPIDKLHQELVDFRDKTQQFLFYKDKETVERFIEEVLITKDNKDLVPILHRFGAYIETLFGQVNMRVVLANVPFEYPQH